jgi:GAF domain-containing protein
MTATDGAPRDLGQVLAEFARAMSPEQTPHEILERMGSYATELLPIHGVGVLLKSSSGGLEVATANTEAGRVVETLEAELAEGPCSEALATGEQILVPDLAAASDRYPRFVPRALDAGVKAIHALPMSLRSETVGSIDLIALEPVDLTASQIATAQMLADVTISYLANSRAFTETSQLASQLQHALDSRIVIEQAKGVLSERRGVTVSEAFEVMRRHARNNHLKLHAVAEQVIRGELQL